MGERRWAPVELYPECRYYDFTPSGDGTLLSPHDPVPLDDRLSLSLCGAVPVILAMSEKALENCQSTVGSSSNVPSLVPSTP